MKARTFRHILAVVASFMVLQLSAIPAKPQPERLVNDYADLFSSGQEAGLERILTAFSDSTSNQIAVLTVHDLEGMSASEYAIRTGLEWGVGSEKFDNGIVILVKPKTSTPGEVFIAVGYGLEGAIPDAYAKRIVTNLMIPHFKENDYFGGVSEACGMLMKLASGEISEATDGLDEEDDIIMIMAFLVVLTIIFLILAIAMKNGNNGGNGRSRYDDVFTTGPIIIRGGNPFGGSSSGGGFGGGFGGFGGFGGGSFGGGGAGGSW